uniref:Reverse transcriptase domain-containing protein n=1 Tax=Arion vulgaris TaxID=1028688 RepID=A0A0B7BSZ6_9EUPU
MTKILLRIMMRRIRSRIRPEISDEQCGFVEGKGTSNAIYILRTLIERSIEVKADLYLCFIDYTKAFDNVRHQELSKMLESLNIDSKDLRIIQNIYWQQTAAIRTDKKIGTFQKITKGVRQGCVLSPDLFSLYCESIFRSIKDIPGIAVGGHIINNLRYADDTVLIARNEMELQKLVDKVVTESNNKGLSLNIKKTEVTTISKKQILPKCTITVNGTDLRQVQQFKYLGVLVTSDGRCRSEIKSRIGQAKTSFLKMRSIICNKSLSIPIRMRVIQCYIEPILTYGCESWTMNTQIEKSLRATEMWFYRIMRRRIP